MKLAADLARLLTKEIQSEQMAQLELHSDELRALHLEKFVWRSSSGETFQKTSRGETHLGRLDMHLGKFT